MNCNICGKPVTLTPSAAARAASPGNTQGWSAADYTRHFPQHAPCLVDKRSESARQTMKFHRENPGVAHVL